MMVVHIGVTAPASQTLSEVPDYKCSAQAAHHIIQIRSVYGYITSFWQETIANLSYCDTLCSKSSEGGR